MISYQVRLVLFAPYFDGLLCVASRLCSGLATGSAHHQQLVKLLVTRCLSKFSDKIKALHRDVPWSRLNKNAPKIHPFMESQRRFLSDRFVKNHLWDGSALLKPYPYHPWDLYIYLHEWSIRMVNVGNYVSPMDAMGYTNTSWVVDVLDLHLWWLLRRFLSRKFCPVPALCCAWSRKVDFLVVWFYVFLCRFQSKTFWISTGFHIFQLHIILAPA